jgi:DNA-binding IclR family transcriptional regulator
MGNFASRFDWTRALAGVSTIGYGRFAERQSVNQVLRSNYSAEQVALGATMATDNELDEARSSTANSTADRAIEILAAFTETHPIWTAGELATRFDMPRSTTYRYLNSLRSYGLIADDENGGLRLGARIIALARVAKSSASIVTAATPSLRVLSEKFGEMVALSERIGHEIIPLERLECRHQVRITFMRGEMLPWPATAAAKILLAFADPSDIDELFRLFTPTKYTAHTISSVGGLKKELALIRKKGFAVSDEERDDGVRGIAAAIVRTGSSARYCVSVGGPSFRLSDDKLKEISEAISQAARTISQALDNLEF